MKATNNKLIEFHSAFPSPPVEDILDGDKWEDFYPDADAINEKPLWMLRPLGNPVWISCFVDPTMPGTKQPGNLIPALF